MQSSIQIFGLVVEIVSAALVGILLDRFLGTAAAVIGLSACLVFLIWLHWDQIRPLIKRQPASVTQQSPEPPLESFPLNHPGRVDPFSPMPMPRDQRSTTSSSTSKSAAPELAPAGFISFLGQVLNGMAPMMQENQTQMPLDDVHLSVTESIPNADSDCGGSGTVAWNKEIEIGTVRALLTKDLPERFPIGGQERISFYIFMETRLRSYIEKICLTKKNETQYDVKLEFGGATPLYTRMQTITMVQFH